jgi:chemotaxis protein histidine kinase CheA/CheY-like chemotaxis protein
MQPEQQQRIMGYFIEEAKDHLNTIERGLLNLQSTLEDSEMVNEVFRAAHSVKGGAAMLGITAIQHTSHRLEDYFKILKETAGIRVDQRLESLLLRVFDNLQELLELLQGPFGLTEEASSAAMAGIEPVFGEIEQYLGALSGDAVMPDSVPTVVGIARPLFNEHVSSDLREMLDLFKHADSLSDGRAQLVAIADRMRENGQREGLALWVTLLEQVKAALANPDNAYRTLAAVVIKELKQAQDWIKLDQPSSIAASAPLLALLPIAADMDLATLDVAAGDLSDHDADFDLLGGDHRGRDLEDLDLDQLNADFSTDFGNDVAFGAELDGLLGDVGSSDDLDFGAELDNLLNDDVSLNVDDNATTADFDGLFDEFEGVAVSGGDEPIDDQALAIGDDLGLDIDFGLDDDLGLASDGGLDDDDDLGLDLLDQVDDEVLTSGAVENLSMELDEESNASLENLGELFMGVDESELTMVQDLRSTGITDLTDPDFGMGDRPDLITQALDLNGLNLDDPESDSTFLNDLTDADDFSDMDLGLGGFSLEPTPEGRVVDDAAGVERDDLELGAADLAAIDDLGLESIGDSTAALASNALDAGDFGDDDFAALGDLDTDDLDFATADLDFGAANFDGADLDAVADDLGDGLTELQLVDDVTADDWTPDGLDPTSDRSDEIDRDALDRADRDDGPTGPEAGTVVAGVGATVGFGAMFAAMQSGQNADAAEAEMEEVTATGAPDLELMDLESMDFGSMDLESPDQGLMNLESAGVFDDAELDNLADLDFDEPVVGDTREIALDDLDLGVFDANDAIVDAPLDTAAMFDQSDDLALDLGDLDELDDGDAQSFDRADSTPDAIVDALPESLEFDFTNDDLGDLDFDAGSTADTNDWNAIADDFGVGDGLAPDALDLGDDLGLGNWSDESLSDAELSDLDDLSFDDRATGVGADAGSDPVPMDGLADLMSDVPDADSGFDFDDLGRLGLGAGVVAGAGALGMAAFGRSERESDAELPRETDEFDHLDALIDRDADTTDAAFNDDLDALLDDSVGLDDDFGNDGGLVGLEFDTAMGFDRPEAIGNDDDLSQSEFSRLDALLTDEPSMSTADADLAALAADPEFDDLERLLLDDKDAAGQSLQLSRGGAPKAAAQRRSLRAGKGFSEQTMRVSVKHLDSLSNLVGELVVNRNSLEQDQERMRQSLDNLLYQVQQLSDVGQRMQDLYERSLLESSLVASRQNRAQLPFPIVRRAIEEEINREDSVEYDPLEMDRFTGFHTLSQEMIELIVRVRESASDIEFIVDETDQVTRMFRQVTTQLQEGLTRSRMVPFAQTADRLPRAVRDIAMKVGKQAELIVEGRETLIDKMILEHLYDPMTHLVNNAITHGVEMPDQRKSGGKPDVGKITIRAFHQGNQTVISVSDDGAGIDIERVRMKGIEKGLISSAEAQTMSRLDLFDLIFHPGFSTRDQADDFAGRGVGMDVVRTSLTEIRGVVTIDSNPGKGTTFTIRLPLTLSISKALCCISDKARIAFPMDGVEDMLDLPKDRLRVDAEGQMSVPWRDTVLPLRPLTELLAHNRHLGRGNVYGGHQEDDIISVVVLRSAGSYLALQVDQVLGEQEIVIKQLEGPVPKPVGIAGATVLGDGRIMPIADVLELIDLAMGRLRRDSGSMWEQDGGAVVDVTPEKVDPLVLIVDDSITVRELLSMTFNKVGYRVEQARDGQEAWEKLRAGLPCDIVFCDIEMPRMDGLELLSRIQKDPQLKRLPVAMLTSRGADRHRQMATSLGARGYFTKPYLEEALLDAAARMLKGEVLMGR